MACSYKCRLRRYWTRLLVGGLFLCLFALFVFPRLPSDDSQNAMFDLPLNNVQLNKVVLKGIKEEHALAIESRPRTLEALLESILLRVNRIEEVLFGSSANASLSSSAQLSKDSQRTLNKRACELPASWESTHPNCQKKIEWMQTFWRSDTCYEANGVDGSKCSIVFYLSEKESHCPVLEWRLPIIQQKAAQQSTPKAMNEMATRKTDLNALLGLMTDNPTSYNWIKSRITRMWPKWENAFDAVVAKQNWTLQNRPKLRILIHMGFLTKESGFKFSEKSTSGGPLGELVQWSDLIASLFILGHQLTISTEIKTFTSFAQADPALKSSCQISNANKHVDLIYTDIVGLRQMKRKIPGSLLNYKCRLRVLDSFGTQAEFNDPIYFTKHKATLGGKPKNVWGGHRLNLRQFFTMFPHSPDNSFLGFVVEMHASNATTMATEHRNNSALVYGKEAYMWKDATPFLKEVQKQTQLHSTVNADKPIFPGVVNHGVLNGEEFHQLLRRVKIFVGLGFPYEGPAPLEAIANGAVFLNPKFVTPKGRRTEKFFAEKPTLRALTSQSPYLEEFIGDPYVLTFDISNGTAVREAVAKALAAKTAPYLPYEFTAPGMLERVNAFLLHQDWCSSSSSWPPFSAAQIVFAQVGQSCQTACSAQGLVCERTFFTQINRLEVMKGHGSCTTSEEVSSTQAPAVSGEHCLLQDNELLFSCATEPIEDARRLCPCRDFVRDQIALCAACL